MGVENPRPKYPEDTVAGGLQGEPKENPSSRSKSMSADRQPARSRPAQLSRLKHSREAPSTPSITTKHTRNSSRIKQRRKQQIWNPERSKTEAPRERRVAWAICPLLPCQIHICAFVPALGGSRVGPKSMLLIGRLVNSTPSSIFRS
jgi:hypothetical protein